MKWQEARKHYPDEWLLIEAIHAHSVNDKRILDDLAVLNAYDNSAAAMKEYGKFHRESPQRELYEIYIVLVYQPLISFESFISPLSE